MYRLHIVGVTLITLSLAVVGCKNNVIDTSAVVDPGTGISFSADVQGIFTRSCSGSGCHIGETTNGVNLTTYSQAVGSTGIQYGRSIVNPLSAAESPVMDKISHQQPRFGSRMPLGRPPLGGRDIALIRQWIDEGALDN